MGRGLASKGKKEGGGPDWLAPPEQEGGGGGGAVREEKPKRRRRDDDDDFPPDKKGIRWGPIFFLILMVLPGLLPLLLNLFTSMQQMGWKLPVPGMGGPNPYRSCLVEFYADWAPEKLGGVDDTLSKFEGRERQLFAKLGNKYKKKANFARCVPKKEPKKN